MMESFSFIKKSLLKSIVSIYFYCFQSNNPASIIKIVREVQVIMAKRVLTAKKIATLVIRKYFNKCTRRGCLFKTEKLLLQ